MEGGGTQRLLLLLSLPPPSRALNPFCLLVYLVLTPASNEVLLSPCSDDFPKGPGLRHVALPFGVGSPRGGCAPPAAAPPCLVCPSLRWAWPGHVKSQLRGVGEGKLDRKVPGNVNGNSNRLPCTWCFCISQDSLDSKPLHIPAWKFHAGAYLKSSPQVTWKTPGLSQTPCQGPSEPQPAGRQGGSLVQRGRSNALPPRGSWGLRGRSQGHLSRLLANAPLCPQITLLETRCHMCGSVPQRHRQHDRRGAQSASIAHSRSQVTGRTRTRGQA